MDIKKLGELLSGIDLDIELDNITTIDELDEAVQEFISQEEIIYYNSAMDYLKEHDPSLTIALELASDYGFQLKDLNSEKLATILYQDDLNDAYQEIRDEAEELLAE